MNGGDGDHDLNDDRNDDRRDDGVLRERVRRALAAVTAPDVVFAVTRGGRRTVVSGGHPWHSPAPAPELASAPPREARRYELGSLSKTFTVLLLSELDRSGTLALDAPLAAHLPGLSPHHPHSRRITLRHLATHTSGLPRVPRDIVPGALLRPYANGYADYDTEHLLRAFARTRLRHAPGSRWRYSNFGLALLGSALEHATGTAFAALLSDRLLRPLGLSGTCADPARAAADATGFRGDGRTPLPPAYMGAFAPAGGVRATPADLLTFAEAHLRPDATALPRPLRLVQIPLLRRGFGHRHTHTLAWFHHPAPGGPLLFHSGATFGQQAFTGYHPASGTGVVAVATRHDRACGLIKAAYALLYDLCSAPPAHT